MATGPIGRRAALGAAALAGATALAAPAVGQRRFPSRPVRFLIPWAPGGILDGFMRLQAELFQQDTGQSLVIENRAGARGTLARRRSSRRGRTATRWRTTTSR
jgi:tripartite-type tricarboxylate transporter receptor subunit TctC